jgi:hypothetical protein
LYWGYGRRCRHSDPCCHTQKLSVANWSLSLSFIINTRNRIEFGIAIALMGNPSMARDGIPKSSPGLFKIATVGVPGRVVGQKTKHKQANEERDNNVYSDFKRQHLYCSERGKRLGQPSYGASLGQGQRGSKSCNGGLVLAGPTRALSNRDRTTG